MLRKHPLIFREVTSPVSSTVTKFGGQPVWLSTPAWPLSRSTGQPMQFIGQVAIDPNLFGTVAGRLAYLFLTDWADGTFDFDLGENAVIIQPDGAAPLVATTASPTGPALYRDGQRNPDSGWPARERCEFSVTLGEGADPPLLPDHGGCLPRDDDAATLNQIGGTPCFMQEAAYPPGNGWRLLLQLDSTTVPFAVNFGDGGIGHIFLSADGREARFGWQCL